MAHDESQRPVRNSLLVGMGHDGGVEDRRRFEGIFARKERPDQQFTGSGEGSMRENMAADPFKMNPEQRLDIEMA